VTREPDDARRDADADDDDLDDDALIWAGDADRGGESPLDRNRAAVAATAPEAEPTVETPPAASVRSRRSTSALAALVVTVLLGGALAAETALWAIGVQHPVVSSVGPLLQRALFQFGEFLAILACPLWFGVTVALTRGRPLRRALWLGGGVVLLLPWPYLLLEVVL
jgi:hypothetical protein